MNVSLFWAIVWGVCFLSGLMTAAFVVDYFTLSLSELIKAKAAQDKEPGEPVKAENEPVDGKTGAKTGKTTNEAQNGWNSEKTDEFFDGLNEVVEDGLFGKEGEK